MQTPAKALAIATPVSLPAVIAATVAAGPRLVLWVMWACWVVLAVTTAAVLAADRRQHT
ncbi:hypothetical protein ABZZ74_23125 [Streptomyces sp. NPDC006476]|uniref:hypothetical protein n=1 Tax=Streptomyces sp. NPDC006476 TaxID=3157175 RepID=UPI00339E948C